MSFFEFASPTAALLLLFLPLFLGLFVVLITYRKWALASFAAPGSREKVSRTRSNILVLSQMVLLLFAWLFACLALMDPRANPRYLGQGKENKEVLHEELLESEEQEGSVRRRAHDVLFFLDASASMAVPDSRTGMSRLDFAKELIDETVRQLDGQSAGLYAFTSAVSPVVPQTMDYLFLRLLLRRIDVNEGDVAGTDFLELGDYIQQVLLKESPDKLKTVVILSDGGDTHLEGLQDEERSKELETLVSRLEGATDHRLQVFTIGLGTKTGEVIPGISFEGHSVHSSLDEDLLEKLSGKGGGRYFFANDYTAPLLAQVLGDQMRSQEQESFEELGLARVGKAKRLVQLQEKEELDYDLFFQIPLAIAILCLALELFLPLFATTRGTRKMEAS